LEGGGGEQVPLLKKKKNPSERIGPKKKDAFKRHRKDCSWGKSLPQVWGAGGCPLEDFKNRPDKLRIGHYSLLYKNWGGMKVYCGQGRSNEKKGTKIEEMLVAGGERTSTVPVKEKIKNGSKKTRESREGKI